MYHSRDKQTRLWDSLNLRFWELYSKSWYPEGRIDPPPSGHRSEKHVMLRRGRAISSFARQLNQAWTLHVLITLDT